MTVILLAALTADGYIARSSTDLSTRWTSREDARFFSQMTKKAGAVIMGSTTFETLNKPLSDRKIFVLSNQAQYDFDQEQVTVLAGQPAAVLARVQEEGFTTVVIAGGSQVYTQFMLAGLVDELYVTTEPVLFGAGIPLFSHSLDMKIELLESIDLSSQTRVSHYKVVR